MRRVVVCGAAVALAGASIVGLGSVGAEATPDPDASGVPTSPAVDPSPDPGSDTGRQSSAPQPKPPTPDEPGSTSDAAPDSASPTRDTSVARASAVMVTPEPPAMRGYRYGTEPRQRLDAYFRPVREKDRAKTPSTPAVLVLHGGYWMGGDKRSWKSFAQRLTWQGFTVFAANYRLAGTSSKHAAWPAQRDDSVAALEFIRANADRWNVDPTRIAVVGSSAGGMLATQLGTYGKGSQRVRGVVALSPVNTPYLAYRRGAQPDATPGQVKLRSAVLNLVKCVPDASDKCWVRVQDTDVVRHVSADDAPMLLLHSKGDFVPVTHSERLATALRKVDVPATVETIEGEGHSGALLNDPQAYPQILRFLKDKTRA